MNTYLIITGFAIFLSTLTWKLVSNLRRNKNGKPIFHGKEWRAVAIINTLSVVLLCSPVCRSNPLVILGTAVDVSFMLAMWFWFLFDGLFNVFRGQNWWWLGTDDPDDANTDNFLQNLLPWQCKAIKIGSCAVTTFIYWLIIR